MIQRRVTKIKKNKGGDIVALCNMGSYWSPRDLYDVIRDIEIFKFQYYAQWKNGKITRIELVDGPNGKYLRTKLGKANSNDLFELPEY
jgi:hypothetical protein